MKRTLISSLFLLSSFGVQANQLDPLPTPLTLEYVLSLPSTMSPEVLAAQANQYKTQALMKQNQAQEGLAINLQARLGQREFNNERQNHHLGAVHFGLPLYDFGQTDKLNQAWLLDTQARETAMKTAENEFRLMLMQAYFNVLLADLAYRVENEAMAIAFVTLDKVREDHAIGRVSDVTLYEHEMAYSQAFVKRQNAQTNLRRSRMLLANTMGRSDAIISRIDLPRFENLPSELEKVEDYLARALDKNPEILAGQHAVEANRYRMESVKASRKPEIRADAWVGQLSSYPEVREGHWQAEISMRMPLFDSGLTQAKLAQAQAETTQTQAQLVAAEQRVREQVTNLYFQLVSLNVEQQAVEASKTFAGFNMDYKRALYENEQQSDFGDALVRISQADYDALAFELKRALLWSQMLFATGEDLSNVVQQNNNKQGE